MTSKTPAADTPHSSTPQSAGSAGQRPPQAPRAPSPRLCSAGLPAESDAGLESLLDDTNCFLSTALGAFEAVSRLGDDHELGDSFYAALFTLRSAAQAFAEVYDLAHPMACRARSLAVQSDVPAVRTQEGR